MSPLAAQWGMVRGEYFCVCWSGGVLFSAGHRVPKGRRLCRYRSQDWEPDWMEQGWNCCQGFTYTGKRINQSGQTGSRSPWDYLRLKCGIDLRTNPDLSEEILQSDCFFFFLISLFLTALGLHCSEWAFSSCGEQGLLSRCDVPASHCGGFSGCRAQALGLTSSAVAVHRLSCPAAGEIFPGPEMEPVSSALAGGFLTTQPPGKPMTVF